MTFSRCHTSLPPYFFINGPTLAFLSFIFGLYKQTSLQFLQQIYVKNVHPECSAGIRTHDLQNMSFLPQPLDQGSGPWNIF